MIRTVFSTDARGFNHPATVLASILRRTESAVAARIYTRGCGARSFCTGRLRVDFVRCEEEDAGGRYPKHVGEAVFDRLRIIRDEGEWDRVLVLDHDMLVFCDLAGYFAEPFEGNLLLGRLFGEGNTLGFQLRNRGGLPEAWRHAEAYPYFFMGPMMNLAAMRREGVWERLLEAHAAIGRDEQMSLTAACGGRVREVGAKWNLVPQWDGFATDPGHAPADHGGAWRNGVPEGLIHWTGPAKPWHHRSRVWRADLWETELCGWQQLREGLWEKPLAVEVEPEDLSRARALLLRGWRVRARGCPADETLEYPDFGVADEEAESGGPSAADLLRYGPGAMPFCGLAPPVRLVLEGPRSRGEMAAARALGYLGEARIRRSQWAAGGPHPKVLAYSDPGEAFALAHDEDCYLSRLAEDRSPALAPPLERGALEDSWAVSEDLGKWLRESLEGQLSGQPEVILELGPGQSTRILAGAFPATRIIGVENDARRARALGQELRHLANVEIVHAPLDPTLPWYDLGGIAIPRLDCVLVDGPAGMEGRRTRRGALSLLGLLKPGSIVILDDTDRPREAEDRAEWGRAGLETVEDGTSFSVLRVPLVPAAPPDPGYAIRGVIAEKVYVVSLPEAAGRLAGLRDNWEPQGIGFELVPGMRPAPEDISWREMRGMEAYGHAENLRTDYVIGAAGCKRAGIRALEEFLASGARTALICQDDCRWRPQGVARAMNAMSQLPADWDLVYFSASARQEYVPYSLNLVRVRGARLCTAVLWKRETAAALLPGLAACDCELDRFLELAHAGLKVFCVVPMPAYQAASVSNITGLHGKPSNH